MNIFKKLCFVLLSIVFIPGALNACVGARPMAMGGGFIGVADDVNSVYWNPAGLGQITGRQVTYTRTMSGRDRINYDDFAAFVGYSEDLKLGYGVSYIGVSQPMVTFDVNIGWYALSIGAELFDNFYAGGNIKYHTFSAEDPAEDTDSDSAIALDINALFKASDKVTIGLLIQNANEPEIEVHDASLTWGRNVRVGMAYNVSELLVLTLDVYDFMDDFELGDRLLFGAEYKIPAVADMLPEFDMFALRTGYYMGNYTFGFGLSAENLLLDYVFLGDGLEDTRQVALSYLF